MRRRRDSLAGVEVFRYEDEGVRSIILPKDFLVSMPNPTSALQATRLPDGRVLVAVARADLAEMVVETIQQIREDRGTVSEKRVEMLRKLAGEEDWNAAEQMVATISSGTNPN